MSDINESTNTGNGGESETSPTDGCKPNNETYKHFSKRYDELKWKEAPLHYYSPETEVLPCAAGVPTAGQATLADSPLRNNNHVCTIAEPERDVSVMGCAVGAVPQQAPRLPINGENTALLVVDVQPEYWSNCPMVRKDFPSFPTKLKRTVDLCRERRVKIIWVRADYRRTHSPWLVQFERLRGKEPGFMVEVPCNPEAEDFTWEDFATPMGGEVIIPKSSWSSTSDTALKEVLRVCGIDTVLVCGLITSVCVQHSAFGVFEAGYRTLLVTDACGDRGRARHEAALALYGDYMYELVTSHDLEDPKTGILKAKPVWLTLNTISRRSPDSSSSGAMITNVNSVAYRSRGWERSSTVSPLSGSMEDLQRALPPESSTSSSSSSLASYLGRVNPDKIDVDSDGPLQRVAYLKGFTDATDKDCEVSTVPTSFSSAASEDSGLYME